jgi:AcrR family transcriptional regulator
MSKGQQTRATILNEALRAASVDGFQGISIGMLAERLNMSKSGLFAHFGSKEELEKAMLDEAAQRFMQQIWQPAMAAARGRPRIEVLFREWLDWSLHNDDMPGGCLFVTLSAEYDDKPGPVRDHLAEMQGQWQATLARSAKIAIEEGHFRKDMDPKQFAYELQGIFLSLTYFRRLLRDSSAVERAQAAFKSLLDRSAVMH